MDQKIYPMGNVALMMLAKIVDAVIECDLDVDYVFDIKVVQLLLADITVELDVVLVVVVVEVAVDYEPWIIAAVVIVVALIDDVFAVVWQYTHVEVMN